MDEGTLRFFAQPTMADARMVLGFDGWMNGGDVSLGTVGHMIRTLDTLPLAKIRPEQFYIYSFPGSMEVSSLFRPHTVIEDGLVRQLDFPSNRFHFDEANRLILFHGKEPNINWHAFADSLFTVAEACDVRTIIFLGSYAGVVPHTRDPRLYASISGEHLAQMAEMHGLRLSTYDGPAGFSTYLTQEAARRGVNMMTLVAEIPAYVQGTNPRCIEAVTRRLAAILGVALDVEEMREKSDDFEAKLDEAVVEQDGLAEMLHRLESDYDNEFFETEMGDLQNWLEGKGIRLD